MLCRLRIATSNRQCRRQHRIAGDAQPNRSLRRLRWLWGAYATIPALPHISSSRSVASCNHGTVCLPFFRRQCCGCGKSISLRDPNAWSLACLCRARVQPNVAKGYRSFVLYCQAPQGYGRTSPCGCIRFLFQRPAWL